jgi:hypothetical protein
MKKALIPTNPSSPRVAASTEEPSDSTVAIDTMPPFGKYTCRIVSPCRCSN